jgi:hypothetical protein
MSTPAGRMPKRLAVAHRHLAPAATTGPDREAAWAAAAAQFSTQDAPVHWSRSDWDAMAERQASEPLFRQDRLAAVDVSEAAFLRDGVLVLPGVLTERATVRLTVAMQETQELNDAFVQSDWRWIPWPDIGAESMPPAVLSADQQAAALGNSQAIGKGGPGSETGVPLLRRFSIIPEYFPVGHHPELMSTLTHPDMLALNCELLGGTDMRFDHSQLFTRPAGFNGSPWHSHVVGGKWDDEGLGAATVEEYRAQNNVVFCIVYPQGFRSGQGALKIVRGSHLLREVFNLGSTDDSAILDWINSRSHPVTSAPLEPQSLSLPPGSMVCLMAHAAHAVEPRASDGSESRLGCLFAYRSGETAYGTPPSPGREVPPLWAMRAAQGKLPRRLTELLKGTGVFYPHWAKEAYTSAGHLPHTPGESFVGVRGTFFG